ncbi:MAG: sugar transferase [Bacteroidota bacterium]|nr:sugar transferase [Bacteroidota bacterium]MDP4245950.1 sugar transferase [Bacteroidota bacterium]MDP4256278.1 sugar transferase [Bacteroidota bacterium]MDP4260252.1 sugar transferase [Bacteroidota bacterium]
MNNSNTALAEYEVSRISLNYLHARRIVEVIIILLLSPLIFLAMGSIALCIRLFDKGPVFFIQNRPGKNGRIFRMYKFRTMVVNADTSTLTALNDKRITKTGRVLRKYKLDELPQCINILKGEMSFIGPRPVPENFYSLYRQNIPSYDLRHLVLPGITGLAQINQGYTATIEGEKEKFDIDLQYIRTIGLATDTKIVWQTVKFFFKTVCVSSS